MLLLLSDSIRTTVLLLSIGMAWWGSVLALPLDSRTGKPAATGEIAPESVANAEFRKGIQAELRGKREIAKGHFLEAIKLDAEFAPAFIALADLALKDGDRAQSEKYLKQAESRAPRAAEVHLAWGRLHLAAQRRDQAEASFKLAHDLNPKAVAPLLELGDLYLQDTLRRGDAAKTFAEAVELAPDNKFAVYSFGVASASIGRRDDALKALERAAKLAPQDPAPLRAAGRLYLEAGDTDKALSAFDRGLKRQANFLPLMLDRGDALARQGKWPDSIKQFERAAQLAPSSAEVQLKLGDALQGAQHWEAARATYARAIELDGKEPLAYNNLAWMLVQQGGMAEKAVEAARKAVTLSPNSAAFLDTLGWAQRAAGDLAGAGHSLRRATELEPKSAEFQYHYGIVMLELKNVRDARSALERALDPRFRNVEEVRRLLRSLPKDN